MSHMTAVMSYMTAVISHMTAITKTQHPIKAIKNFRLDRYWGCAAFLSLSRYRAQATRTLAVLMGPYGRCNSRRARFFYSLNPGAALIRL